MKKIVYIRNIPIGDGNVTVQSMTNTKTTDVDATIDQIVRLHQAGADFVRISIPDVESAEAVDKIIQKSPVPIVGDIHYGEVPALIAIEKGIDKIRINPGNMTDKAISAVVKSCAAHNIPVRIGVNKGSSEYKTPEELALACVDVAKKIEDMGWDRLVLAVKTSSVPETVRAYEKLSELSDYPLHVGLTEAGVGEKAIIKSAVAIGSLLLKGIGDTIRVSLAGDPVREVYAAKEILHSVGIKNDFVEIIVCPTCARTCFPVEEVAKILQKKTENINKNLKIAVMGCVVNGIGEAKDADFGVAGGKDKSVIFKGGKILLTVPNEEIIPTLLQMTESETK